MSEVPAKDKRYRRPPIRSTEKESSPEDDNAFNDNVSNEQKMEEDSLGSSSSSPVAQQCSPQVKRKKLYPGIEEELSALKSETQFPECGRDPAEGMGKRPQPTSQPNYCHYICALFFGIAVIVFTVITSLMKSDESSEPITSITIVQQLKKDFADQPDISMKVIKLALRNVIDSKHEPSSPAILLLVSSSDAEKRTVSCFANKLAKLVSYRNDSFAHLNGDEFKESDSSLTKVTIDNKLEQYFSPNELNVFLMENLDMISGKAALIFQKYCDHENAAYKNAVFIMTVSSREIIPNDADTKKIDSVATNHLKKSWLDLNEDTLRPLLARISVSVSAIVKGHSPHNC